MTKCFLQKFTCCAINFVHVQLLVFISYMLSDDMQRFLNEINSEKKNKNDNFTE